MMFINKFKIFILVVVLLGGMSPLVSTGTMNYENQIIDTDVHSDILLVHATYYEETLVGWLNNASLNVDVFDASFAVPTLAELSQYSLVIIAPDVFNGIGETIGNNLADYIDQGGKVVAQNFAFHASWGVAGRFALDFSPFTFGNNPYSYLTYSGGSTHTIAEGVASFSNGYADQTLNLTANTEVLVEWDNGFPMIAQKGNVLGLNFVAGVDVNGGIETIFVNSIEHMLNQSNPNVLLLHKSNYANTIQSWINESYWQVDQFEVTFSIPTFEEIIAYDLVLFVPDTLSHNNTQLGDLFVDYLNNGGKVIVTTFGFHDSWGVNGVFTSNYSPFTNGIDPYTIADYNGGSTHPIMNGVTSLNSQYTEVTIGVTANTEVLSYWNNGFPLAAQKGDTLGLNFYPGTGYSGNMSTMMLNSVDWMLQYDNDAPTVSGEVYQMYYELGSAFNLTIDVTDHSNVDYSVKVDGVVVLSGSWGSGVNTLDLTETDIISNYGELSLGVYNVSIYLIDEFSNVYAHDFLLYVVDTIFPEVDYLSVPSYFEGETGNDIEFIATDYNLDHYNVTINTALVVEDTPLVSGESNFINIDGFVPGTHDVVIIVTDIARNSVMLEFTFTVYEEDGNTGEPTDPTDPGDDDEPNNSTQAPQINLPIASLPIMMFLALNAAMIMRRKEL